MADEQIEEQEGLEEQTPPEQEAEAEEPPARDLEAEAEARKYGWRPKEEFDRDPDGWVDADRFLELPSTHKKMLKDELRERDKTLEDYKLRMERLEKTNKVAMDQALAAQKTQYEAELRQVRAAQRKAVEEGDTDRYDRLEAYEQSLLKEPPKTPEMEPERPGTDPYIEQYQASPEGQWLNDPILRKFGADAINLAGKNDAPAHEQVKIAEAAVRDYFPHKFEAPAPKRQKVDGGGLAGGKARQTASKLPPEALKAAKDFVAQGIFKSVDDYAKAYFEEG